MLREVIQGLPGGARKHPPPAPGTATPRIAILGTGFGGLGMAIRLRNAGITSFTIYEKADGVGGTWRDNSYPGAECDVPSHLYSLSFAPKHDWSRHYPEQPEILAYLEDCTDRFGLRPHIRFGTEIATARFDDAAAEWRLETTAGEELVADVLICGLGQLNRPYVPDIEGLDEFEGAVFHSARWNHEHPLDDESVAVIGNGASAVQFVPRIAPVARTPHDLPALGQLGDAQGQPAVRRRHQGAVRPAAVARPGLPGVDLPPVRGPLLHVPPPEPVRPPGREGGPGLPREGGRRSCAARAADARLPDRVQADPGGERLLLHAGARRRRGGHDADRTGHPDRHRDADGHERAIDTIVLATGFESTDFLAPIEIVGLDGRKLDEAWHAGAEAYLGLTVSGFPNLFMLYGPNTNLGHNSIVFMLERQISYVLQCVEEMVAEGLASLDVRPEVMAAYNRAVQKRMHQTVWEAGCSSWYKDASGKVTNNWPTFTVEYWLATRHPRFGAYRSR